MQNKQKNKYCFVFMDSNDTPLFSIPLDRIPTFTDRIDIRKTVASKANKFPFDISIATKTKVLTQDELDEIMEQLS